MKYKDMLNQALEKLKGRQANEQRFSVPKARGHIQGNKTIISNFYAIAKTLNRKPEHLLKFILRELASAGELTDNAAIIKSKVSSEKINNKINKYVQEFVICPDCGRPDTILKKERGFTMKICQACGSKHPVRTIK